MKILSTLGSVIDRIVWAVGCITIIGYSREHWPLALQIVTVALFVSFGLWYLWRFFVQPFRAGLRGEQP
jgi:ABC-type nickel/cobalt efflux system permease component RcnA